MRRNESSLILSQFDQYLTVLAIVDSFLILMFIVDNIVLGQIRAGDWFFTVVSYVTHPIKRISITMSMVWVVIIAIRRYLAVTQPLKTKTLDSIHSYVIFLVTFSITVNVSK